MTVVEDLDEKQRLALASNIRLIEACPGAGKTRAVVRRFIQQADDSDKGVALLSFTQAAIEEVKKRCSERQELLRPPYFVGTFDSFLHRYVVTPVDSKKFGRSLTYLQSWSELTRGAEIMISIAKPYAKISLTKFSRDSTGAIQLLDGSLSEIEKSVFDAASKQDQKSVISRGIRTIAELNSKGVYDSDSARWRALEILRGEQGSVYLKRLAGRFSEVIVDEFQDCASLEHELLSLLEGAGVHITVVADPNQAIFGFRHAEPRLYADFKSKIAEKDVVTLDTNYRSSRAICDVVHSLRYKPLSKMTSGASAGDACGHVYLLGGTDDKVRARFTAIAEEQNISFSGRMVLAHRKTDARQLAAGGKKPPQSASVMFGMLQNLIIIRTKGTNPLLRRQAVDALERQLLTLLNWNADQRRASTVVKLEILGKNKAWIRQIIGKIVSDSKDWTDSASAALSVRKTLKESLDGLLVPLEKAFSAKLKKPTNDVWSYWLAAAKSRASGPGMNWSTIHASKGHEYEAVLLKVPDNKTVENWLADVDCDERRVFYVGASRARLLLVLCVSGARFDTVSAQLAQLGLPVSYERLS